MSLDISDPRVLRNVETKAICIPSWTRCSAVQSEDFVPPSIWYVQSWAIIMKIRHLVMMGGRMCGPILVYASAVHYQADKNTKRILLCYSFVDFRYLRSANRVWYLTSFNSWQSVQS